MTAYEPSLSAQKIAEARDDDATLQEAPWSGSAAPSNTGAVLVWGPDDIPVALISVVWGRTPVVNRARAAAIARTRNNLRTLTDQLEAAGREIERLRVELGADKLHKSAEAFAAKTGSEVDRQGDDRKGHPPAEIDSEYLRGRAAPLSPERLAEIKRAVGDVPWRMDDDRLCDGHCGEPSTIKEGSRTFVERHVDCGTIAREVDRDAEVALLAIPELLAEIARLRSDLERTETHNETGPHELHDEARAVLHRCWAAAVGTPGYNNDDWKLLERQLHARCSGGCLVRGVYPKAAP